MVKKEQVGIIILRYALAFVFLWFGFSQLGNTAMWTAYVPTWATHFMSAGTLVLMNGTMEIILGIFLALGILTRWVALILGIHLFVIASSLGLSAIGVRDIGLSIATLSLFFANPDPLSITLYKNKFSASNRPQM